MDGEQLPVSEEHAGWRDGGTGRGCGRCWSDSVRTSWTPRTPRLRLRLRRRPPTQHKGRRTARDIAAADPLNSRGLHHHQPRHYRLPPSVQGHASPRRNAQCYPADLPYTACIIRKSEIKNRHISTTWFPCNVGGFQTFGTVLAYSAVYAQKYVSIL